MMETQTIIREAYNHHRKAHTAREALTNCAFCEYEAEADKKAYDKWTGLCHACNMPVDIPGCRNCLKDAKAAGASALSERLLKKIKWATYIRADNRKPYRVIEAMTEDEFKAALKTAQEK